MSYRNEAAMTCPHCGAQGDPEVIVFQPRAPLFTDGSPFSNAGGEKLAHMGRIVCEECHEPFLYRLSMKVICEVAVMPDYNEIEEDAA